LVVVFPPSIKISGYAPDGTSFVSIFLFLPVLFVTTWFLGVSQFVEMF